MNLYDEPRLFYREPPKKLKGKAREAEIMRILEQLKADYVKLNKIWGIGIHEDN